MRYMQLGKVDIYTNSFKQFVLEAKCKNTVKMIEVENGRKNRRRKNVAKEKQLAKSQAYKQMKFVV